MPLRRLALSVLCCLASSAVCTVARADSYTLSQVYGTGNGNSSTIGITDAGLDLVRTPLNYLTFDGATGTSTFSAISPSLTFDNGTSCSVANNGAFTVISQAVCNNGRVAFIASTNTIRQGVFFGTDPLNDLLYNGLSGGVKLDAMGDIAFDSFASSLQNSNDNNYFAYDVTSRITPEPSSLLLLSSGAGSLLAIYRRRKLKA